MPREETLSYYENKIKNVLLYIQNNLDKDLSVKTLAGKSNISFFHFHRIIKACLGVPLGLYINRLRLDAAVKLIRYSNQSISEIAIKIGYNDVSAFSKSFSREFGITPSDYRSNKESSINSNIDFHFNHDKVEKFNPDTKIRIYPVRKVVYIEAKGRYGSNEHEEAWELLMDYATANKMFGWNTETFSIYYDDPEIVGMDDCKFDCCFSVKKNIEPDGIIKTKEIAGGKYLLFRYKGPYEKLWDLYDLLYRDFILRQNEYQLRDSPVIEKYIKYSEKTRPENLITEIQIPVF